MKDLLDTPYDTNLNLASFDITNMCTNIPTNEFPNIIQNLCTTNCINPTTQTDITNLCNIVRNQNYFQFNSSYYTQKNRISNGRPHHLNFIRNVFTTPSPEKYHSKWIRIINVVLDGYLYVIVVKSNATECPLSKKKIKVFCFLPF